MVIGPFSMETVLGAIATLVGAGVPLFYRYVWGSKSHVSISHLVTLEDSEWRDGRNNDRPIWTHRILIRVSNNGWRDGVISNINLSEVELMGDRGKPLLNDLEGDVLKIELERYSSTGGMTRLNLEHRTNYAGQIVSGRDDELMAIAPFILQESELGGMMKKSKIGVFTFTFQIEDNKRVYSKSVKVSTSLEDSAGGKLRDSSSQG